MSKRPEELVDERTADLSQEIRRRRQAEETLRKNAHFLQTVMDAIPNPIFYKNANGRYQGCNSAFETCLGREKSEIMGASAHDISPTELADQYDEMDTALLRQGGVQTYESTVRYADGTAAHGIETILVVEDNDMVRALACEMLKNLGYQVLEGKNPDCGVELVTEYPGSINLLLTDVIMPGMNGKELFETLKRIRPDLKALFMSGYTSNVIGHHGVLDEGVDFIQKPFSLKLLSEKVRSMLDA